MRISTVAILFALSGCGTSYYEVPADPSLLPYAQSPADVRAAVIRALDDRKFVTENEQAGRVIARYDRGDTTLRLAVEYSDANYRLVYMGSAGYKTLQEGPTLLVDSHANGIMKKLKSSIDAELKRPARERADAEKRQREYQMMLEQQHTAQAQANANAAQANAQTNTQVQAIPVVVPIPVPATGGLNVQSQTSTTQGSQSITCCINGALYVCPSQEAFRQCMTQAPSQCTRDTSRSCK